MTRLHTAAFAAVCAMWLAACGREPVPPIRVGTYPGPTSELVFLAQQRGWLPSPDYRLVEFINDGEVMRAFRNGSIEAAFVSLDEVLSLAQSGMDPVILFVTAESRGGDAILSHADVTSFADLRGRRVAVQVNSASAYLLRRSLKTAGLAVGDLQIVNVANRVEQIAGRDRLGEARGDAQRPAALDVFMPARGGQHHDRRPV